jgi:serine/threonine-protein kinase
MRLMLPVLALAVAVAAALLAWNLKPGAERRLLRFQVAMEGHGAGLGRTLGPNQIISPDGRRLVFAARSEGRAQLYLRNLDALEATPMADTGGAQYPFFSPDGEWVAFFADGKLKRVSIAGGAPRARAFSSMPRAS